MGTVSAVSSPNDVVVFDDSTPPRRLVWCPACRRLHFTDERWGWNGDPVKPTFDGSILTWGGRDPNYRCHSFLTDGVWNYLSDCSHEYAGKSLPAIPLAARGDGEQA